MSIPALEPAYMKRDETSRYAEPKDTLGRDQFLTLLVAQLQHQDPLNPMESTDFSSQLAQFSSLEQLFGVNKNLMGIQENLGARENGNLLDYIGKTVKTENNTIFVTDGQTDSSFYALEDRADVTIYIYNEDGLEVRRIYRGWQDAGEHEIAWDGRDNAGKTVDDSIYAFEVEARDEGGFIVPYNTYLTGEVTGVTYESGIPYLMIGDKLVTPENIVEVRKNSGQ
ncbi:MAG: flagellar hook assembly protein FlgD [Desulfobacterales bacterium]|nr:flagellar hook assembly protein FlgD [Desulfobacterales bacterium]